MQGALFDNLSSVWKYFQFIPLDFFSLFTLSGGGEKEPKKIIFKVAFYSGSTAFLLKANFKLT